MAIGDDTSFIWIPSAADESSLIKDLHQESVELYPFSSTKGENGSAINQENGLKKTISLRQKRKVHEQVLKSYESQTERLQAARNKVLGYTPGSWLEKTGDRVCDERVIPKKTSLLLLGPKASGKSSLVNRISEVFEKYKLSRRAQVSSSQLAIHGTCFVHRYMVPRFSGSFCLYDTRSFSDDTLENLKEIYRWMTKGVHHGELVLRDSDTTDMKARLNCKARLSCCAEQPVMINFIIFVVNGVSVLEAMTGNNVLMKKQCQEMATVFNNPLVSFKDEKPVVVVTHGDLLSIDERVSIRVYLGELLGVPPTTQIFDIPDNDDPVSALAIVDMVTYCLERSDNNLPIPPMYHAELYHQPITVGSLPSALANATPAEQRIMLGEILYPLVELLEPVMAPKVTGILLEMDVNEVLHLLQSPKALAATVAEAKEVLRKSSQEQETMTRSQEATHPEQQKIDREENMSEDDDDDDDDDSDEKEDEEDSDEEDDDSYEEDDDDSDEDDDDRYEEDDDSYEEDDEEDNDDDDDEEDDNGAKGQNASGVPWVFDTAEIDELYAQVETGAVEQFKTPNLNNAAAPKTESTDVALEDEDESGFNPRDIELVMVQASVSRPIAFKALKDNYGDIVCAIMDLTA